MKRVLSAGVMLLVSAFCLTALAQTETPPPASSQVAPQTKPKSTKKSGATKTAKTAPAKSSNKRSTPAPNALAANKPNSKNAAAYYEIGMSHYQSKRFKDAVEAFQQAIRLGSVEPKTYYNLGQSYYSLSRYIEAREAYKKAVRVKPDWAEAHYQLSWIYHILGDRNALQSQYKTLQTLDPEMAAKFQKLITEDEMSASAARNNVTKTAAGATDAAPATTPAGAVPDKTTTSPTADASSPSVPLPDITNQPAVPTETTSNSNSGNNPATGAGGTSGSTGASSTGTPAKDETAASEPAAEPVAAGSEQQPTNVYRVGVGDVLDVRVLNTPTNRSTLFTVMSGGLIEYPLTGGTFSVLGLTTDEIGTRLSAELKRRGLGESLQVVVGVRDYTSHAVFISGLVNYPGTKILRREAVPLYVLIAEAQLRPDAGRAVIMRASESIPLNDLTDPASLNVLVKAGDVITISARQQQYYFIGGRINSPGQKIHQPGLTLIQAILAAGGLSRSQDTVEISREEADGRLTTTKYALKEIKAGKIPDPRIQPGDRIEVGH